MIMFGSFLPSPLLVWHHKVYSGVGADIVMESLHSSTCRTGGLLPNNASQPKQF